ncbi:DUF481 domain-containing protein [Altererythrobacter aurantiacus]|uniref:DUF481 domain-containing protein n=1 Tax=Parapontixanthobacter aurantiacus TaxID=1463599 RepID=A0A844ZDM4_9SPHN|nr:DUF481 domain-containing protein [Parapontixanthobacter aurantiacus]MXO85868.1 DUF481 domain-containing protein [Parapontixanthobacter aurantiacus]
MLSAGFVCGPAQAELPLAIRDMIDRALDSGEPEKVEAVIALAREMHPEDAELLDWILSNFNARYPSEEPLPEEVLAMIEEAKATGDTATVETVVALAKSLYPDDAAMLDAIATQFAENQPQDGSLPEDTQALIDAALESRNERQLEAVIALAKKTQPEDGPRLDAIAATFAAEQAERARVAALAEEERIREAGLFDLWEGKGEIGASRATGNSDNLAFTAGLDLKRVGIDWRHEIRGVADFRRNNGNTTREYLSLAYEPNYDLDDRTYVYGLAQIERGPFQGFNARYSLSGGAGYRIYDDPEFQLAVQGGPAYRRIVPVSEPVENRLAALAAIDVDWQINERTKFTQDSSAYVQSDNSTFVAITGVETEIIPSLSARLSYRIEYDTDPPPDTVGTDTLSRITLIYGF